MLYVYNLPIRSNKAYEYISSRLTTEIFTSYKSVHWNNLLYYRAIKWTSRGLVDYSPYVGKRREYRNMKYPERRKH